MKKSPFKHKVEAIPAEEILANRSNAYEFIDFDKQETLEEVAERLLNLNELDSFRDYHYKQELYNAFIVGIKYQQKIGYSEEDMLKSFMAGIKCESNNGQNFEQFIKQFKNK
jgi:hypothetical protein